MFEAFLNQYDDRAWAGVLEDLEPSIHEVDRAATRIWFAFFPIGLARALGEASDQAQLAARLLLLGRYRLEDQIDTSAWFLYGHRYWRDVKQAVADHARSTAAPSSLELAEQIRDIARRVSVRTRVNEALLVGITAVAVMTLEHVGAAAFTASAGEVAIDPAWARKTPEKILRARARDDSQGIFGFLRGAAKRWTVAFDERRPDRRFTLIDSQHLTTAAMTDKRKYHVSDPRCMRGEGPIPVQCRNGSCGTCWVGLLGGAEKTSPVDALERRKIREYGYIDTDDPRPLIRLACLTQAFGAVSIVIPPWNGMFGDYLRARERAAALASASKGPSDR